MVKKSSFINMFLQYKAIPNDGNSIIKFTNEEKIYENHTYYKGYNFVDIKKILDKSFVIIGY